MKIKINKLQSGGAFAPFLADYTPTLVNESYPDPILQYFVQRSGLSGSTTKSSTSKSSSDIDDTTKLLKDLRGLDNDVSVVTKALADQARTDALFGTGDPVTQYYRNLELVNRVIQSKEDYDSAYTQAQKQGALSEAAITSDGKVVVKSSRGYQMVSPAEALKLSQSGAAKIQKNSDLLADRKHNTKMAFQNGVLDVVQNSTSFKTVYATVQALTSQLGNYDVTQEGYSVKEGNQIASGIAAIKNAGVGPMDGVYKIHYENSTQAKQAEMAINAIYRNLTDSDRAYLKLNSDGTEKGAYALIQEMVMGKVSSKETLLSYYQTGYDQTGAKKGKEQAAKGIDVDEDPAINFGKGYGTPSTFSIRLPNGQVGYTVRSHSIAMMDEQGHPQSIMTLNGLGSGRLGGMMDLTNAYMGDIKINDYALPNVLVTGRVNEAELPVDQAALAQGIVKPDLQMQKKIQEINETKLGALGKKNPEDLTAQERQKINQIYQANGIAAKYNADGTLTAPYRRFMMINGLTSEKSFDQDPDEELAKASNQDRDLYTQNMQKLTDSKAKLNNGWFWGAIGKEEVYQGVIFIPFKSGWTDMYTGSGIKNKTSESTALETAQQEADYARENYVNPGNLQQ